MSKKKYQACVISVEHGTVKIGDTVFQPATGARIASRAGKTRCQIKVPVADKSMASAKAALLKAYKELGYGDPYRV